MLYELRFSVIGEENFRIQKRLTWSALISALLALSHIQKAYGAEFRPMGDLEAWCPWRLLNQ